MNNSAKKFIVKLLVLACFILAADFVGGIILKSLFYKQRSGKYFTTTHALVDCKEDIIIFGSSHAAQHFDAPLMQRALAKPVFNFGNQGQSLFYVYPLVKSILAYHQPKLIILNLDYGEFHYNEADYQRLSIFLPYYHTNPTVDSAISMVSTSELIKARSALYRYNSTIGYMLLNTYTHTYSKSMISLGYDPVDGNICSPGNNNDGEKHAKEKVKLDQVKIDCLIRLINYIRSKKVKLLITTTPLFKYNAAEDGVYKQKLDEILSKMNVDYLDEGRNPDFKGNCTLFHDESHLNTIGAAAWTTLCVNYIKQKYFISAN